MGCWCLVHVCEVFGYHSNMHAELSSSNRDFNYGIIITLRSYFVCADSEGSGEYDRSHREAQLRLG